MEKKEIIDRFIISIFDETLTVDLKQMLRDRQGLDFAIITLVCSGIELMGALDQGSLKNPDKRFYSTIDKYFPEKYIKYREILYDYFRCGIVHQAFIKPGAATARNPDYKEYHLYGVIVEGEVLLFIHPDIFVNDFFCAIEKFKKSIEDYPQKIDAIYKTIKKIYKNRLRADSIETYKEMPPNPLNITQMPQPVWLDRSDISVGCLKIED